MAFTAFYQNIPALSIWWLSPFNLPFNLQFAKIDEFQREHLGKLQFYLEALDRDVRKPHEQPSIGVLLCATKNHEVVESALSRTVSPALVAGPGMVSDFVLGSYVPGMVSDFVLGSYVLCSKPRTKSDTTKSVGSLNCLFLNRLRGSTAKTTSVNSTATPR